MKCERCGKDISEEDFRITHDECGEFCSEECFNFYHDEESDKKLTDNTD